MFEKDEIEALDIKRIYRFMDKNVKKEDTDAGLAECDSGSEPE